MEKNIVKKCSLQVAFQRPNKFFFSVLQFQQFIPQGWQPAWTLSGFLLALLTLLCAGDMVKWGG